MAIAAGGTSMVSGGIFATTWFLFRAAEVSFIETFAPPIKNVTSSKWQISHVLMTFWLRVVASCSRHSYYASLQTRVVVPPQAMATNLAYRNWLLHAVSRSCVFSGFGIRNFGLIPMALHIVITLIYFFRTL